MTRERYLGLMSGTSLDGLDLALVCIEHPFQLHIEHFSTLPFSDALRSQLWSTMHQPSRPLRDWVALDQALSSYFADRILEFLQHASVARRDVRAIGHHGITFWHQPEPIPALDRMGRGTLQLGDAWTLHARTGIPVVYDFRRADMALGGQGAPLVPFLDRLLYTHPERGRIALNLGGIANLSIIPSHGPLLAFDTGPANILIDALARLHPKTPHAFDRDGNFAAAGQPLQPLLEACLEHPYFARKPPKSTGRELFGFDFLRRFLDFPGTHSHEDLVHTATLLSATSIANAIKQYAQPLQAFHDLILSGGGIHNNSLRAMLAQQLPNLAIASSSDFGLHPDAKEAVLMAVLAWARIHKIPSNLPHVTGARRSIPMGAIAEGFEFHS